MRRLLWKEMRSSTWILGITCLGAALLVLIGDPLFFRGEDPSNKSIWLLLPFFALGLRSYSSELGADTVSFLYSRPIKWWKIWAAKLLAPAIQASVVLILSASIYGLTVPEEYRRFLLDGLGNGLAFGAAALVFSFLAGFVVSALMPGIALSFGAIVAVLAGAALPLAVLAQIGSTAKVPKLTDFAEQAGVNAMLLVTAGAFFASILLARRLPKLGMRGRWLTWVKIPAIGYAAACLFAAYGGFIDVSDSLPSATVRSVSPDARWALYEVGPKLVLLDTRTGSARRLASGIKVQGADWSPDSRHIAYLESDMSVNVARVGPRPVVRRIARIHTSWRPDAWQDVPVGWDPSGSLVAVSYDESVYPEKPRQRIVVLSTEGRQIRVIENPRSARGEEALSMPAGSPLLTWSYGPYGEQFFWPPGWSKLPEDEQAGASSGGG